MIYKSLFRLTITAIALLSLVGLTACGGGNKGASNSGSSSNAAKLAKNTTAGSNSENPIKVSTNSQKIPSFKLGANGELDESALAKKVLAAIQGNSEFGGTPGLYVAQLQDNIVLKSCVSNKPMIKKVVAFGESIPDVASVDLRYDEYLYCNRGL